MISIPTIRHIGEISVSIDLGTTLAIAVAEQHLDAAGTDALVATKRVVSCAEYHLVKSASAEPTTRARRLATATCEDLWLVRLVLDESRGRTRHAAHAHHRHRLALVMANAGINRSNLGAAAR